MPEKEKSDDDGFQALLVNPIELPGFEFEGATSINWQRLGATILGSTVITVATGVTSIIQANVAAASRYLDGAANFSSELLAVVIGLPLSALRGAWSFGIAEYGIAALPIAVVVVLVTFVIVSNGLGILRRRYL